MVTPTLIFFLPVYPFGMTQTWADQGTFLLDATHFMSISLSAYSDHLPFNKFFTRRIHEEWVLLKGTDTPWHLSPYLTQDFIPQDLFDVPVKINGGTVILA